MNERDYMLIAMGLGFALVWLCFNKAEAYVCAKKSKNLSLFYFSFAICSAFASITITTYPFGHNYYAVYILKGYAYGVSASLWSFERIKEKSERKS